MNNQKLELVADFYEYTMANGYLNKNMKNKADIDYISKYFIIVKQGKKYTLLKSN